MFGGQFIPENTYKPKAEWFFEDNGITGILAYMGHKLSANYMILPYGLDDGQRDLILWAYETGHRDGYRCGEARMRIDFKRLMNLDGYE